ncbi:MAG: ribulose-phosphate 3-epimerase [Oscillospiraceae bacterium]|jgi:ribulose-phosphate 3-epimerase|nr:ribulose-phosphate 3-epimerase [Oscillospiraceae bacterium]
MNEKANRETDTKRKRPKIAPSLLSADFTRLYDEISSVATADYLHFDVMDGVFVPNISIGLPVFDAVRRVTDIPLDVHLMITEPSRYAARFAERGADIVSFHVEADDPENIARAIAGIHSAGKRAGLALKPATAAAAVLPYITLLDMIVVMTVEPGFGGQKFMSGQLTKLAALRELIDEKNPRCELEVDGGVDPETAKLCTRHGASVLVAGSDVFGARDRAARIEEIRGVV